MADYIVYKGDDGLKLLLYNQYREEDHLMRGLMPGRDFVVIPEATTENQAKEAADRYFSGSHPEPTRIDCWAAGALTRQQCLGPD